MALTLDRVVDVAMELLERDGLPGVSFRKIAAELGVSAPTLYWHVDSKRRLLDLMAERLMQRVGELTPLSPAPGEPWWEWLERRTRAMYLTLIQHRDAPLVAAGNRPTATALPVIEGYLDALADAGFSPADAFESILSLGAFTIGCALEWQAEAARAHDADVSAELASEVGSGRYPTLVRAVGEHRQRGESHTPHDQMFEQGLRWFIRGMRSDLAEQTSPPSRSGSATQRG